MMTMLLLLVLLVCRLSLTHAHTSFLQRPTYLVVNEGDTIHTILLELAKKVLCIPATNVFPVKESLVLLVILLMKSVLVLNLIILTNFSFCMKHEISKFNILYFSLKI